MRCRSEVSLDGPDLVVDVAAQLGDRALEPGLVERSGLDQMQPAAIAESGVRSSCESVRKASRGIDAFDVCETAAMLFANASASAAASRSESSITTAAEHCSSARAASAASAASRNEMPADCNARPVACRCVPETLRIVDIIQMSRGPSKRPASERPIGN